MDKFASICILSYQRLDFLKRKLESLFSTNAGAKYELIISDDGSDLEVKQYLEELLNQGKISYLILNGGKNRGIGEAIRRCFKISSGDYLFKLDTDIEFKEGWLKEAINILDSNYIGCVSLLNYNNYDAQDERFKIESEINKKGFKFNTVSDFISCLYGVRRGVYETYKEQLGTDGWHQHIKSQGFKLAISNTDMITNFGFGLETSIYLDTDKDGKIITRKTHDEPLIF